MKIYLIDKSGKSKEFDSMKQAESYIPSRYKDCYKVITDVDDVEYKIFNLLNITKITK